MLVYIMANAGVILLYIWAIGLSLLAGLLIAWMLFGKDIENE